MGGGREGSGELGPEIDRPKQLEYYRHIIWSALSDSDNHGGLEGGRGGNDTLTL